MKHLALHSVKKVRWVRPMQSIRERLSAAFSVALQECQKDGTLPVVPGWRAAGGQVDFQPMQQMHVSRGDFFTSVVHQLASRLTKVQAQALMQDGGAAPVPPTSADLQTWADRLVACAHAQLAGDVGMFLFACIVLVGPRLD